MKTHNINDAQLQTAIDEACQEVANGPHRPICAELSLKDVNTSDWSNESLARRALAKAFLARLPEPTPPVVDGKTPSINDLQDIYFANASMGYAELPHDHAEALQAVAEAVTEAAIARMEAVDVWSVYKHYPSPFLEDSLGGVRARLIAAARGQGEAVSQPATFEAHGQTWTRHTPGDPMPCDAWQPAVGDVVTLKSGGPKMAVCQIQGTVCKCQWFKDDVADVECFEIATLQPA